MCPRGRKEDDEATTTRSPTSALEVDNNNNNQDYSMEKCHEEDDAPAAVTQSQAAASPAVDNNSQQQQNPRQEDVTTSTPNRKMPPEAALAAAEAAAAAAAHARSTQQQGPREEAADAAVAAEEEESQDQKMPSNPSRRGGRRRGRDEFEEAAQEAENKNAKKRKKKMMMMMKKRCMERRKLRVQLYELHKKIDVSESLEDIQKAREINNTLLNKITHPRELVLDTENSDMIATKYERHAESLVKVPRYDALRLVQKLRQKCTIEKEGGGTAFDWVRLGRDSGLCFNKIPSHGRFLSGLLEAAPSNVKQGQRRKRAPRQNMDDFEETQPEQVHTDKLEKSGDGLSAAEANIKSMTHRLWERYEEECARRGQLANGKDGGGGQHGDVDVDGIKFLMNPKSFTQTVENIFHFSFLIQKSQARIGVRDADDADGKPPGLYLAPTKKACEKDSNDDESPQQQLPAARICNNNNNDGPPLLSTQCVFSFNMQDWRRLCKAYKLKEGDLEHRETGQPKCPPPTSQNDANTDSDNSTSR